MSEKKIALGPGDIKEPEGKAVADPKFICAVEPGVNIGDWIITGPDGERNIVHSDEERDREVKRMVDKKRPVHMGI